MAVLTKAAIQNNITTFLADNVTGDITPAEVRLILTDMVDSYFDAQATNIGISNIAEFDFVTTPPNIGDHLIWNGTKIVPYTLPNPTLESVLATGNITGAYNIQINSGQRIEWANSGFVNMLVTDTLTSNKTLTLPNITGTLATLGDVKNFSNENLIFAGNRSHNTAGFWLEMTTDGGLYAESWMFMGNAAYARNEYGYANSWTRWAALTQTLYANNIATVYVEGGRVGIGSAPAASTVLDIRAGALPGDLPLRARNNADTLDLLSIDGYGYLSTNAAVSGTGDKDVVTINVPITSNSQGVGLNLAVTGTGHSSKYAYLAVGGTRLIEYNTNGSSKSGIFNYNTGTNASAYFKGSFTFHGIDYHYGNSGAAIDYYNILAAPTQARLDTRNWQWGVRVDATAPTNAGLITTGGTTELMRLNAKGNLGLGTSLFGTNAATVFSIATGTAPTTTIVDGIQIYSADIVAGNAALHTMTENGDVIKHYSQNVTDIGAGAAFVPNTSGIADDTATWGGFTGGQVVKALLNSGWLKV